MATGWQMRGLCRWRHGGPILPGPTRNQKKATARARRPRRHRRYRPHPSRADQERAGHDLRQHDGVGAAHLALDPGQGEHGLLRLDLRRQRPDGRPGAGPAGPSRRDHAGAQGLPRLFRRRHRAGRHLRQQRPLFRRQPPERHLHVQAGVQGRRTDLLPRPDPAPYRPRRPGGGRPGRRQQRDLRGRAAHPAEQDLPGGQAQRHAFPHHRAQHARARHGAGRRARADRRAQHGGGRDREAGRGLRRGRAEEIHDRAGRLHRAAGAKLHPRPARRRGRVHRLERRRRGRRRPGQAAREAHRQGR